MTRFCVLASGSEGNAAFLSDGRTNILIDAGISLTDLTARLVSIAVPLQALDAILITHEHGDHIGGLLTLLKKRKYIPRVYLTAPTAAAIDWGMTEPNLNPFCAGDAFSIGDIAVQSIAVPHDAAGPVGYHFTAQGIRIAIAIDLGYIPTAAAPQLADSDLLVLESNHDTEMLRVGPYPWCVKSRVGGRQGHLSNDAVSAFFSESLKVQTRDIVLAHVSRSNNHPELVRLEAETTLRNKGLSPRITVAEQDDPTRVFEF